MKLFYKPGACSLASHIALIEINAAFEIEAVDTNSGRTEHGVDYSLINSKGYVPALQLKDGDILTEGPAILQFLADKNPQANLIPDVGTKARARMLEQLTFVSSEVHKAFGPLFREGASEEEKEIARARVGYTFESIEALLSDGRDTIIPGQFTIADAYLFVVANWANFTGIDLKRWPHLKAFITNVSARPSVQSAMRAEGFLQ
ncbi:glutathione transferase GstA [Flexibacterium corallicola]|uniref:glutathione transferase GstA n=1 Tax=Flexibacterium corallicola TaxID=3037259 RepID=UPI00286EE6AB|nr:glutathione transferase GstA [Pseudovibrio sp. M1P-2-3]